MTELVLNYSDLIPFSFLPPIVAVLPPLPFFVPLPLFCFSPPPLVSSSLLPLFSSSPPPLSSSLLPPSFFAPLLLFSSFPLLLFSSALPPPFSFALPLLFSFAPLPPSSSSLLPLSSQHQDYVLHIVSQAPSLLSPIQSSQPWHCEYTLFLPQLPAMLDTEGRTSMAVSLQP